MILLSLVLVVLLERLIKPTESFHYRTYFSKYADATASYFNKKTVSQPELFVLIWVAIPAVIVAAVQHALGQGLLGLIFSVFVLFLCYGCPQHRRSYQQYIEAACRDDQQACFHYAEKLGQTFPDDENEKSCESLGEALIWLNFRHYFAVIFWFVLLGAAGAVFYVFARNIAKYSQLDENKFWLAESANRLLEILVWVPARITGLAYLFVGHFSQAFPVWLSGALSIESDSRRYLEKVAKAAETVDAPESDCLTEPCLMLKLAKRALLFLVCIIAVLTLAGVI